MTDFPDTVWTCFRKFANFRGRAGRSEFWYWALFYLAAIIAFTVVDMAVIGISTGPFSTAVTLVLILPGLAAAARRLHDAEHSAWWLLILLVPLIGLMVVLLMASIPGTRGPNRFGPEPD